MISAQLMKSSS